MHFAGAPRSSSEGCTDPPLATIHEVSSHPMGLALLGGTFPLSSPKIYILKEVVLRLYTNLDILKLHPPGLQANFGKKPV